MNSEYRKVLLSRKQCGRNLKGFIVHSIGFNKATQEISKAHFLGCQDLLLPLLSLSPSLCVSLLLLFPSMHSDKRFSGAWATVWTKWDGLPCGFWQEKLQLILWLETKVQKVEKHWAVNESQKRRPPWAPGNYVRVLSGWVCVHGERGVCGWVHMLIHSGDGIFQLRTLRLKKDYVLFCLLYWVP